MSKPKITAEISQLLKHLCKTYPQCFRPESLPPLPLAHGIHWQLLDALYPDTPPLTVRDALRIYTVRPSYQACLQPGAVRVNLQGEPVGVVGDKRPPQAAEPEVPKAAPVSANETYT